MKKFFIIAATLGNLFCSDNYPELLTIQGNKANFVARTMVYICLYNNKLNSETSANEVLDITKLSVKRKFAKNRVTWDITDKILTQAINEILTKMREEANSATSN